MNFKLNILLLLISISFTLLGCPAGHFHEYKFIGEDFSDTNFHTKIKFNNETDLYINCGYFYEFIGKKENGITAIIKVDTNTKLDKNKLVKVVKSSLYGELKKVDSLPHTVRIKDTLNTLMYKLNFEKRNERKTIKEIEKDTITIELITGKKLLFSK
ncbi:MAG: hypothetical protein R2821_08840 [Flavobacteriaceae bacterium]|jgi:hypothetical protein|nr:hypothetical protein [Flavobacteriaceae bacterium]